MNHILKRISPLAILFVAIAGILAFSSAANAQSTSRVQVKSGTNPGLALTANGLRMVADNNNDFAQRWDREAVTSSTFRSSAAAPAAACGSRPAPRAPPAWRASCSAAATARGRSGSASGRRAWVTCSSTSRPTTP